MKISIVIPTYNCGQYIRKAIDSVLNQPYENKELIVIDGGSNDNTVEILKSYGNKIHWISEKDNGQSDAINKGFKTATGEIIAWLNADDYYEPNIFNKISEEFKNNPQTTLVYGNCNFIFPDKKTVGIPPIKVSSELLIKKGNLIYQPASFYSRKAVQETGSVNTTLQYWMEYDLYIKLLKKGNAIYTNKELANFTVREDQKSNIKNLLKMDKELLSISKKYGGKTISKIVFSSYYHKIYHIIFNIC